jgi:hypothetical protein
VRALVGLALSLVVVSLGTASRLDPRTVTGHAH